ncbi:helix-turn-helix domain-containing protein [Mangrovihabitans endophyticus]|uniref:Transcriptional regulator n=1 Tax=Mangrovihabitans endophyticus TaxID=1751298 RepID=A0A8J3C436_9ACTN|nr:helix-turn-helix transcriptional regulator [Mangrovihabitans endophyticus]GGL15939.1 transcriptional regulator [Mangrovihabitans endophyticus]
MSGSERRAREAFGNRLREIRLDAGLTGRQLAEVTGFHFTKVSRVEHGGQSLSDADIRGWASACGAVAQIPDLINEMRTVDTAYREWRRHTRAGLRRLQDSAASLYERTRLLRAHEHWVVPGLLQTAAYSRAIMTDWARTHDLPDDAEQANQVRMDRQRVLHEGDHRFVFLLAEQALYSLVPSAAEMIEQLDQLITVMDLPRVSLGIIPATAGLGAHTQTAFWIFDDVLVRVETLTAGLDITRAEEIELYVAAFERMRAAAVFGRNARALIAKARYEFVQQSATS